MRELILLDEDELSDMWDEAVDPKVQEIIERAIDIRVDIDYQKMELTNEIDSLRELRRSETSRAVRKSLRQEIAALERELERVEVEIAAEHGILDPDDSMENVTTDDIDISDEN